MFYVYQTHLTNVTVAQSQVCRLHLVVRRNGLGAIDCGKGKARALRSFRGKRLAGRVQRGTRITTWSLHAARTYLTYMVCTLGCCTLLMSYLQLSRIHDVSRMASSRIERLGTASDRQVSPYAYFSLRRHRRRTFAIPLHCLSTVHLNSSNIPRQLVRYMPLLRFTPFLIARRPR